MQTPLDDVPVAMVPFQGRLLVGVGRLLRIYDIGKRKMLRKCENKHIPNLIVDIQSMGGRVYVADVQEAIHFIRYKAEDNQLIVFADETYQRWVWLGLTCQGGLLISNLHCAIILFVHVCCLTLVGICMCIRFMTCCCVLDYNTLAAADKFGNLAIVSNSHAHMYRQHSCVETY